MFRTFFAAVIVMFFGTAVDAAADSGVVRINGSTSVANSIVLPHQAEIEKAAGVKIVVTPNSSGSGTTDLISGNADIAMISSDLDEIVAKISNAMQAYKADKSQLQTVSLGEAKVEFIVNQACPIRKLTAEQIKAIYLGKTTNWKMLGGPDARIDVIAESKGGAMRAMLEHEWLGGQKIGDFVAETDTAPQVAAMVAHSPNRIGFVSSTTPASLRAGTATIETDTTLMQHLSLVTKGSPSPDISRVIDAIKHLP